MQVSMHAFSVGSLTRALTQLVHILEKAQAHVVAKNLDPMALLDDRLYPDMFNLAEQVRRCGDGAKTAVALLAGEAQPAKGEAKERSFPELIERIRAAIKVIEAYKPEQINGVEDKQVVFKTPKSEMKFNGLAFLQTFALPNFYFHVTTAYGILRHNGVEIGKMDFLGPVA